VDLGELPDLNNDHVLSPDGEHVYLSAMDTHIYRAPLAGGAAQRMTPEDGKWHFLHGVSPDDQRLAYVQISEMDQPGQLAILEADGSVRILDAGVGHLDGPEWSPDGQWIYLNTETFTSTPGHAQLARIPDGGGPVERLLTSDTVDWFPHLSADAKFATYVSFPAGTLGHPADLDVEVRTVSTDDWATPLQSYPLFGGQGTLNVNSWAPDSSQFAFVAYPVA
jgi:Tol biopolymer transport system component